MTTFVSDESIQGPNILTVAQVPVNRELDDSMAPDEGTETLSDYSSAGSSSLHSAVHAVTALRRIQLTKDERLAPNVVELDRGVHIEKNFDLTYTTRARSSAVF
eukprot:CAMPEP_0170634202 /NCGR_PEP_ID=MMETSP0224-20130122/36456_1 /TAXON_ID=285029 /ORGANISM="Togula jolla, Strain CCCM 725" /LENGTH=103 /DNA_ID=CAMNT_0010963407 /DNA_START=156 /DNA_END=467 /DNA_ORIENTATION=-